jgi:uncharacterized protein YdeI (YjbR/CyaY-like superfamily)
MGEQVKFSGREEFREWLLANCSTNKGVWLVFGKTGKVKTIRPDEALEEALCFGWIDGQIKSLGDEKYLKKFTPRTKNSKWSEANRALADRLIERGKMTEHGQAAIEQAKSSGSWDNPAREAISDDQVHVLVNALKDADLALANFLKMSSSVRRTYTALYLDAKKEETRKNRLAKIIERLNANKKPM